MSRDSHATVLGDRHGSGDFTRIARAILERRTIAAELATAGGLDLRVQATGLVLRRRGLVTTPGPRG